MKTLHIIVKGKVQGVGFRAKVEHYARKYQINGTVKNLSNGTVEIYAQAESDLLSEFTKAVQNNSGLIKVEHFMVEECEVQKKYKGFEIIF